MRDGRAEAKALGQVVTFGVGHPVAVERIFCAAEAIDLLVGIGRLPPCGPVVFLLCRQ